MDNYCGAEGDRTPDLVNAIHALSQLSYSPIGIQSDDKVRNPGPKVNHDSSVYDDRQVSG